MCGAPVALCRPKADKLSHYDTERCLCDFTATRLFGIEVKLTWNNLKGIDIFILALWYTCYIRIAQGSPVSPVC